MWCRIVPTYLRAQRAVRACQAGDFSLGMVHDGSVSVVLRAPLSLGWITRQAVEAFRAEGLKVEGPWYDGDGRASAFRVRSI